MDCISKGAIIPHTIGIVTGEMAVVEKGAVIMPSVIHGEKDSASD
jgi:serine acetyltransferase